MDVEILLKDISATAAKIPALPRRGRDVLLDTLLKSKDFNRMSVGENFLLSRWTSINLFRGNPFRRKHTAPASVRFVSRERKL
jgi:hypothetical protein